VKLYHKPLSRQREEILCRGSEVVSPFGLLINLCKAAGIDI
jgi:hypothetical protein